jgi:uncharacterized protein YndB with AHSA1/START domain
VDAVSVSVIIDKPREEIFEYLADVANHPEFMDHMFKDWHMLRVDTYGRGAGFRYRTKAPLDRFGWGDLTITKLEAPRRLVGFGRGGKYNRITSYCEWTLEPEGAGATRVELVFDTDPPLPTDKIMETLSGRRRWFRRNARKALKRLRAILEEGPTSRRRGERATVAGL